MFARRAGGAVWAGGAVVPGDVRRMRVARSGEDGRAPAKGVSEGRGDGEVRRAVESRTRDESLLRFLREALFSRRRCGGVREALLFGQKETHPLARVRLETTKERGSVASGLGSTSLLDDGGDGFGRLGAVLHPLVDFFEVKGVVHAFSHGVVGAHLLDEVAIAAITAVNDDDLVVRTILGALTVQTNCYHN